jgi:hypothetical protein
VEVALVSTEKIVEDRMPSKWPPQMMAKLIYISNNLDDDTYTILYIYIYTPIVNGVLRSS